MKLLPLLIVLAGLCSCLGMSKQQPGSKLNEQQALSLAVSLANEKCQTCFGAAPFDSTSFPIIFSKERWHWGGLDLAGVHGYSAEVLFDAWGREQIVEVFLSFDRPTLRVPPREDHEVDRPDDR